MTKKLPEKLRLWEVSKNEWFLWKEKITLEWSSANDIIRTVNQLIDYLTPEAPTDTEERGDWIEKMYQWIINREIENAHANDLEYIPNPWLHFLRLWLEKFMPKPVEQEPTPQATSVKRCWQNHCIDPITEEVLCWKECFETTSVIDVENDICHCFELAFEPKLATDENKQWAYIIADRTKIREILSSLPIQKKRTFEELNERYRKEFDYKEWMVVSAWVQAFAKHIWILSD